MTLDDAITNHTWAAIASSGQVSEEHRQQAEWLAELKELKSGERSYAALAAENAKLRELILDMLVDEARGHNDDNTYYEHVRLAKELGIEVHE